MKISTKISIIAIIIMVVASIEIINIIIPKEQGFKPTTEKTIYLERECKPQLCEENNFKIIENNQNPSQNNLIYAKVFGSIYEDSEKIIIFGTCSDELNHPKATNATMTVYYPNTSIFLNHSNMTQIAEGRFNLSAITTTKGNFLVELNCTTTTTDPVDYAMAYAEFQNPTWTNKIQTAINDIAAVIGQTNKKDFEIDKFIIISPIYPNETIIAEATFSDENGTLIVPDEIGLTILYPNRTLFLNKTKNHFENINNVWNYSEILTSSPRTGTYYAKLEANYSTKRALKTTQFRIATGGPFSVRLDCPDTAQAGNTLNCVVKIVDEGEVAVESTTTVWVDAIANSAVDATEAQTSFSKRTEPQDTILETATINILTSHLTGVFIVRAKTEYLGSDQPDSTASDTILIFSRGEESFGGEGGGGSASYTSNYCLLYSQSFKTCYTYDMKLNSCFKGCNEGFKCVGFECNAKVMLQPYSTLELPKFTLWQKAKLFLNNLLNPNKGQLSMIQEEVNPAEEVKEFMQQSKEEGINKAIKENPITAVLFGIAIVAIVLFVMAFMQYGLIFLFTNPLSLFIIILIGVIMWILWLAQI